MLERYMPRTIVLSLVICSSLALSACKDDDAKPPQSEDAAALGAIISIEFPIKSARWDVFGTPEYSGGVPGPTDYITLMAELEPADNWFASLKEPTGTTAVVPEAARPWLTSSFRGLMEKSRNSNVDLSSHADCRKYATTVKKSGRPVQGFVCNDDGKLLMYLTLSSEN
ncbi:hypothetical protein GTP41_20690 [Pseudoduganella sp. DS3]|uniref:Lipoprotein n=1 Tax=Pseudoduganella guangdongensis TaxID=2692179 RepID=A0A6N9HMU3_9BURK|nr:hypothetical protein [Pseudoduganella guangdongensis]MYN04513.1 hypothetical protein [Pseudoduganella guangdongensis]